MASQSVPNASASASSPQNPIPASELSDHFVIGESTLTKPLVGIAAIKGHLELLHAFSELKKKVVKLPFFDAFGSRWGEREKWMYFVGVAVERFDLWCEKLSEGDLGVAWDIFLPPLDVLMVWHSYILNPLWYAEDAQRIARCAILKQLGCHFISAMEFHRLSTALKFVSEERRSFWTGRTLLEFDPEECLKCYHRKSIKNVCCGQVDEVEFCKRDGTGYLQNQYSHFCSNALAHKGTIEYTAKFSQSAARRKRDGVQKIARDLTKSTSLSEGHLAGSYLGISETNYIRQEGLKIKSLLISHIEANPKIGEMDGSDRFLWEMSNNYAIPDIMGAIGASPLALRIMSAYSDDKVYSVELRDAVVRQAQFVDKIKELRWSTPGFLDTSDARVLPHAVARYHAFLDLMATHPRTMLVPTIDIDLVWHTHQLMSSKYTDDCMKYVGRFIDHDDKVEGTQLSTSFDQTSVLWKTRFGIPYTFCGCPAATPSISIGQRISRFIRPAENESAPDSSVLQPPIYQAEVTLATHPSDHNAVRRAMGAPHDPAYRSISRQKAKEIKKNRSTLYESGVHHPYATGKLHPYLTTFMLPPSLNVDKWAGLDGGNQCIGGHFGPSQIPKSTSAYRSSEFQTSSFRSYSVGGSGLGGFSCAGGFGGGC